MKIHSDKAVTDKPYHSIKSKIICFCFILSLCIQQNIYFCYASQMNDYSIGQEEVDIVFVIDYSNSMNGNDKDKHAIQMIEVFLDIANTEFMRVGYVAHNDYLLGYSEPVSLDKRETRESMKKDLNTIVRSGSTDTGLALKKAEEMLTSSIEEGRKGHIIVLSDGIPDLHVSKSGRTIEECYKDMDDVAVWCADNQTLIDTIAYGEEYDGKPTHLQELSNRTNGRMYISESSDALIDVYSGIISRYTYSMLQPISVGISDGTVQNIEIDVKDTFPDELNILVTSNSKIQDAAVICAGSEINYARSGYYFTSKINNINNEKITLQLTGTKDQEIKVYAVLYQNKEFQISIPTEVLKNETYEIKYYLHSDGKPVEDAGFYKQFKFEVITDQNKEVLEPLSEKLYDAVLENGSMTTKNLQNGLSGIYSFQLRLSNAYYSFGIDNLTYEVVNAAPIGGFESQLEYVRLKNGEEYNLNDYFEDVNGDQLTYELIFHTEEAIDNISLNQELLMIDPKKAGTSEFQIKAIDEEGAECISSMVVVKTEPIWRHYIGVLIGAVVILFMLILYFLWMLIKRQKVRHIEYEKAVEQIKEIEMNSYFSGKMNVYFTKMRDDMEVEPLTFALYQIKEKMLTLSQLLDILEIPIDELDADNVWFKAGQENELILQHSSKNSIMVGTSMICKKLKYSLDYGNKIYITSQNNEYELELHYVSVRS